MNIAIQHPLVPAPSTTKLPFTGAEYLESLRDDREIWIYGERVKDVTAHPAFRNSARSVARLYDALHDPAHSGTLSVPTDTGNGGFTHPFFKAAYSKDDLRTARDAMTIWSKMSYGWMGRTPDYKASFLGVLGVNSEYYGEYAENARFWYKEAQERVLYMNHAIVPPPIDRHIPPDESDLNIHVVKETSAGVVVSGAKVVATNSALTHYNFIAHAGAPVKKKSYGIAFLAAMNAPGVKLFARSSYEYQAAHTGSPFDYPLSSRMDENDSIVVFDNVLIPWENILVYDAERSNSFLVESGMGPRAPLQACLRFSVKLGFIAGLFHKATMIGGTDQTPAMQQALGEILAWRNMFAGLADGMIEGAKPWRGGSMQPGAEAGQAYIVMGPQAYLRVRQIIEESVGSNLIYLNSSSVDFKSEEMRPYLDKFLRGSYDASAHDRVKLMKLFWDAIGTEFGGRHELYEINYVGSGAMTRARVVGHAKRSGLLDDCVGLVDKCMSEYDLDGWTTGDFINSADVSVLSNRNTPISGQ